MKRLFMALTFLALLFSTSSFASDITGTPSVLQSFYQSFGGARNVTVSEVNGLTRITFTMDDELNYAYYDRAGELVVVSRQISFNQLPKALQSDYKNAYSNYFIADVYQFTNDEGTEYYIVLEDGSARMVMTSKTKKWKVFKTEERK